MNRWLLAGLGVVLTLAGGVAIGGQLSSGAQPWGQLLSDNLVFAKSIPFTIGLGVLVGALWGMATPRAGGTANADTVRRFSRQTVVMHWITAIGFLLALTTGAWQYLKGLLEATSPIPMQQVYRLHYVGATLLLFCVSSFLAYWSVRGEAQLLVPRGQWIRHLRGLAHELPRPIGGIIAGALGLNMKREAPAVEQFTYYEKTVSFPTWGVVLTLIIVTGTLKAIRYVYPIPGEVLQVASVIHVAAMVLLAAKLLDHLRYVIAPARWPLFVSMFTTRISTAYVRVLHPAWYDRLRQAGRHPTGTQEEPTPAPVLAAGSKTGAQR